MGRDEAVTDSPRSVNVSISGFNIPLASFPSHPFGVLLLHWDKKMNQMVSTSSAHLFTLTPKRPRTTSNCFFRKKQITADWKIDVLLLGKAECTQQTGCGMHLVLLPLSSQTQLVGLCELHQQLPQEATRLLLLAVSCLQLPEHQERLDVAC